MYSAPLSLRLGLESEHRPILKRGQILISEQSQTENSTFGFAIIAAIVLIGCFIAAFFFKWARPSGKDRLRTGIFIKATFWGIV